MIAYDHYYSIGKSHLFCQDYVLQGDIPTPFLVLSDGCSSSPDTDTGARILCATVKKIIERYWPLYQENDTAEWSLLPDYRALGRMVITEAHSAAELLGLSRQVLDATLLLAFLSNDTVHVYVYGDGCILLKERNGRTGYVQLQFSNNMPFYLNYWPDLERRTAYAARCGHEDTLQVTDSLQDLSATYRFDKPLSFSFSLERYAAVAIASDGLDSLTDTQRNEKRPLHNVAEAMLDFNSLEGDFVKRRVPKVLTRYAQENIMPLDDVAIGAFTM